MDGPGILGPSEKGGVLIKRRHQLFDPRLHPWKYVSINMSSIVKLPDAASGVTSDLLRVVTFDAAELPPFSASPFSPLRCAGPEEASRDPHCSGKSAMEC